MIRRADIYLANLDPVVGSEQGGLRPVLIVQNNKGNRYSPTVIVAAITSSENKPDLPTHISITPEQSGLRRPSLILLEQLRTLDKRRLATYIGTIDDEIMQRVEKGLECSLGFQSAVACHLEQRRRGLR
jgi:mRNA interferase MazF